MIRTYLYLERLSILEVVLHNFTNTIWQTHADQRERNLGAAVDQAKLVKMTSYGRWELAWTSEAR